VPIIDPLSYATAAVQPEPRPMGGSRDMSRDMMQRRMQGETPSGSCACSGSSAKRAKVVIGLALLGTAVYFWRR
jgi:hypothetical protein